MPYNSSKWQKISTEDYVKSLTPLDSKSTVSDYDPLVIATYLELVRSHLGTYLDDLPIWKHIQTGVCFQNSLGYNYLDFFLADTIVHIHVNLTLDEILALASDLSELSGGLRLDGFLPSPFTPRDHSYELPLISNLGKAEHTDSPTTRLVDSNGIPYTWDSYLESLESKRRYKLKRARKDFEECVITVASALSDSDKDWILKQTKKYWTTIHDDKGNDNVLERAWMQILWAWSLTEHRPQDITWLTAFNAEGEILSKVAFVRRKDCLFFSSFIRSADLIDSCANIGPFMLSHAVEHFLCHRPNGVTHLEPTVATSFFNEGYCVYKRTICNDRGSKPVVAVAPPDSGERLQLKGNYYDRGWQHAPA